MAQEVPEGEWEECREPVRAPGLQEVVYVLPAALKSLIKEAFHATRLNVLNARARW